MNPTVRRLRSSILGMVYGNLEDIKIGDSIDLLSSVGRDELLETVGPFPVTYIIPSWANVYENWEDLWTIHDIQALWSRYEQLQKSKATL
jgi:hypothetical protein